MAATESAWTCARCGVTIRYLAGFSAPDLPEGWGQEAEEMHCLGCRREDAAKGALASADPSSRAEERKIRQLAVTEFELRRDPDRHDAAIASAAETTRALVTKTRGSLSDL
jgi:hypothetical protein